MQLIHGTYYFVPPAGERKWINLGKNFAKACTEWANIIDEPKKLIKMKEIIEQYIIEEASQKAERTYKDNIKEATYLTKVFGQMIPKDIKPKHIYGYLRERGKDSKIRSNREISLLSVIFKKAIEWGCDIDINPCVGINKHPEPERERYITDEEFEARKKVMPEWIALVMDIAYFTSARKGDLLKINIQKDIKNNMLYITQEKTGKKQAYFLSDENGNLNDLGIAIRQARNLKRSVLSFYLFCNRQGKPYTKSGFDSIWKRHAEKDGIQNFRFHDIRAKAITDAEAQGINPKKLSGHKTDAMVNRYIKLHKVEKVTPLSKKHFS
tara:strand:+ start:379 stop:1350 length:972 start_codon:yes stop_codon:yes gene_type:complete